MDELRFDGKVALVTGATSGLGRAYCDLLASRGAKVAVNGNFRPEGSGPERQIAAAICDAGGEAIGVNGSVLDPQQIEKIISETVSAFGRLDILINNAGTSDNSMNVLEPDQRLYEQFEIHVAAPMRMVAAAWEHLKKSGDGRVINTASSSAYGAGFDIWEGAYSTAKAAVFAVTRQMAGAGEPHGIKVNALVPWGYSRAVEHNTQGNEFGVWMDKHTPVEKVAAVVAFLVHSNCQASGQFFTAAGGRVNRVIYAATRGYFNPDISPEDVRDNFGLVCGTSDPDGYLDDVFDLKNVLAEWMEHRAFIEGRQPHAR